MQGAKRNDVYLAVKMNPRERLEEGMNKLESENLRLLDLACKAGHGSQRWKNYEEFRQGPRYKILKHYRYLDWCFFEVDDLRNMLEATDSADRILEDPVGQFLFQKSSGFRKFGEFEGEPCAQEKDYEALADRKMTKQTYEKYLSQIIGRPITVEESDAVLRSLNPLFPFRHDTSPEQDPLGLFRRDMRSNYFMEVFSSGKYAFLESEH
jgi:hypothetical protein